MPLLDEQEAAQRLGATPTPIAGFAPQPDRTGRVTTGVVAAEPTTSEIFGASIRRESDVYNAYEAISDSANYWAYDDAFDPLSEDNLKGYESKAGILALAQNREHSNFLKERLDREERDIDIQRRAGTMGLLADIAAGVLSPTSLIPVLGVAKVASVVGKAAVFAGSAGAAIGLQETVLQTNQFLRTKEESLYTVAGGTLLAGALGAAGAAAFRRSNPAEYQALQRQIEDDMRADVIDFQDALAKNDFDLESTSKDLKQSVSAAAVSRDIDTGRIAERGRAAILAGESIKDAAKMEKVLGKVTPLLRALQSPYLQSRIIMQKLINNPLQVSKNANFEATEQSVEQLRELYTADYLRTQQKATDFYKKYKQDSAKRGLPSMPLTQSDVLNKVRKKMGRTVPESSFMDEVGKAVRRNGEHPNEFISKSAKEYRKMFDRMGDEAVRAGIWKELPNRKTAESYFSRMFDTEKIVENRNEFDATVRDWVRGQVEESVGRTNAKYERIRSNIQSEIDSLEVNKFRKASFLQEQAEIEGGQLGLTVDDIKASLEILAEGKPRKPKTMLKAIAEGGGIDIDDWTRVIGRQTDDVTEWNKANRRRLTNERIEGGRDLDDIAVDMWERGYFPANAERPTVDELVEAIDDELRGLGERVRIGDEDALNDFYYFKDVEDTINQLGIKPKDYARGQILLTEPRLKEFREKVVELSSKQSTARQERLRTKLARINAKQEDELEIINEMGVDDYTDEVVGQITDNILGLDKVSPEFKFDIAERGVLKGQKFLIPDENVERFLINDASIVAERYARTMGTDVELMNKFGTLELAEIIKPITREFKEQTADLTGDAATKARKQFDRDIKDVEGVYQLLRGTYPGNMYSKDDFWSQLGRTTLAFNYIRLLGGVAISSIPDVGKQIAYNGFLNFYRDGFKPFAKSLPKIIRGIRPEELEELKFAGVTIQHLTNSRAMTFADLGHRYGRQNNFERFIDSSTKVFSRATGIVDWNNAMEAMAGLMSQRRILKNVRAIAKGEDIGKREKEYLSALGLGKNEIDRLSIEVGKHARNAEDGFIKANTQNWTDADAIKLFRGALKKDVESVVIQRELGDVPLLANTAAGQLMLQFKSFIFATMNKTFLTALQRRDAAVLQGISTMVALGSMTYVIKMLEAGKEPDLSPENLITQGVDRSGILNVFMEVNNVAEKVGIPGLHSLSGAAAPSRYYSRSLDEALLGPTIGTISNVGRGIYSVASSEELSDSDRRNLRKLMPYNNLFYLRWLMQTADADTRKHFGY
ncbi:MAG: hypothetical protein MI745_14040 [Pseudomonadales bacterium]|nr:hypothetical protein [Pseudomonadales bacterium]